MFRRSYLLLSTLILTMILLAGCSNPSSSPIDPVNGGFFTKYFVYPLSASLDWFAHLLWGSYGLAILIVTIIIRMIILPLTIKQYRSSKQMQAIQPELKKLKEKHKDDSKKQQEETMKLFQKNGVNPLAGCLPLLVQMPVLIALYNAIIRNPDIKNHTFLWMHLGAPDPYYILPIIAAATTFIQSRMTASTMSPQMKNLLFIFPILIFVMAMKFAAALPLYWIYTNTFTIVQTYFIYGRSQTTGVNLPIEKSRR